MISDMVTFTHTMKSTSQGTFSMVPMGTAAAERGSGERALVTIQGICNSDVCANVALLEELRTRLTESRISEKC